MKPLLKSIACILGLAALTAAPLHAQAAKQNIVDTAAAAGSFKTLIALLTAADMVEGLNSKGPFTVFAPTDEAFAKLPAGTVESLLELGNRIDLDQFLLAHVVIGEIPLAKALEAGEVLTLQGTKFKVRLDGGSVKVGEATLANADVKTTGGVIHVIDTVLTPSPNQKYNPKSPEFIVKGGECDPETGRCTSPIGGVDVTKYSVGEINEMIRKTGAKFTRGNEGE